jgi:hypothetical protein
MTPGATPAVTFGTTAEPIGSKPSSNDRSAAAIDAGAADVATTDAGNAGGVNGAKASSPC